VLVVAVDVASGSTRPIGTQRWRTIGDIEWMPDGQGFLMSASDPAATGPQIWQVDYPVGAARRVTNDLNNYIGVSLAADGRSLATVQAENTANLWVLPGGDAARGVQLTRGRNRGDGLSGMSWMPGGRLVFGSVASGRPEIWSMDADGSNARQLTDQEAPSLSPSASPDGAYIVFQRFSRDGVHVWRMAPDGSDVKQLTTGGAEFQPIAGPNGSVFFFSPASGQPITYRIASDGGAPIKVSDDYFRATGVSADGRLLLGIGWDAEKRQSALATLPAEGGRARLLRHIPFAGGIWAPGDKAVTHIAVAAKGLTLVNTPIEPGPSVEVASIPENIFSLAWSRDGRQLALARGVGSSDVVLITAKQVSP
jgi:Tol biopolymer transport system component